MTDKFLAYMENQGWMAEADEKQIYRLSGKLGEIYHYRKKHGAQRRARLVLMCGRL